VSARLPAWLGADPGLGGALALMVPGHEVGHGSFFIEDMPSLMGDGGKRKMDHWRLANILGYWTSVYNILGVTVERVHAMPKQGVTSSFSFGMSFGALVQAVASAGLPVTLIPPATWKTVYGLRGGRENKDLSRQKASQMFPGSAHLWPLKKHEGRAEAVLLAHYGSKLRNA
jgi:crossover junction endodeoxyribonuclease RuvC